MSAHKHRWYSVWPGERNCHVCGIWQPIDIAAHKSAVYRRALRINAIHSRRKYFAELANRPPDPREGLWHGNLRLV